MKKHISNSEKQTLEIGKNFAKELKGGEIIGFTGDLGAGKTTLIKGIAKGLGIKQPITSPTFVILKNYPIKSKNNLQEFVHIDAYRINSWQDLINIGIEDFLNQNTIILIEWAEKLNIKNLKNFIQIKLSAPDLIKKPDKREIKITQ